MLRFELRHYMYLPPIFKPRIMSPLNRGSGLFVPFPRGSQLLQLRLNPQRVSAHEKEISRHNMNSTLRGRDFLFMVLSNEVCMP